MGSKSCFISQKFLFSISLAEAPKIPFPVVQFDASFSYLLFLLFVLLCLPRTPSAVLVAPTPPEFSGTRRRDWPWPEDLLSGGTHKGSPLSCIYGKFPATPEHTSAFFLGINTTLYRLLSYQPIEHNTFLGKKFLSRGMFFVIH